MPLMPRRPVDSAFSLVELLLVVTIIVILLALLLPTVRQAVEHGRRVQCMTQLDRMGHGMNNFVLDNDKYLPGPSWYGQNAEYNSSTKMLSRWLAEYMGHPKATGSNQVNGDFICPSFAPTKPAGFAAKDCFIYGALSTTNHQGLRVFGYPAFQGDPEYPPSRFSSVKYPSTSGAVKDIDQHHNPTAGWVDQTARRPTHSAGSLSETIRQIVYFDGHVVGRRESWTGTPLN